MEQGLLDGDFLGVDLAAGLALVGQPLLEQGPAGGEIGRPQADVFPGLGFLEFADAVALAVVFLALELDQIGRQVDIVEIVLVGGAVESFAVARGERLGDAGQARGPDWSTARGR